MADHFLARGFDVVAYDSRAHGESEGDVCTYGFYEKEDLRRVLDRVSTEADRPDGLLDGRRDCPAGGGGRSACRRGGGRVVVLRSAHRRAASVRRSSRARGTSPTRSSLPRMRASSASTTSARWPRRPHPGADADHPRRARRRDAARALAANLRRPPRAEAPDPRPERRPQPRPRCRRLARDRQLARRGAGAARAVESPRAIRQAPARGRAPPLIGFENCDKPKGAESRWRATCTGDPLQRR